MPTYERVDLYFERGEGCYLFNDKGERFLDFGAAFSVTAFGHANPILTEALHQQAQKLWITSNLYKSHQLDQVAKRLVEMTGFADTVFFQNSGVEAWELGVKIIRKYFSTIDQPERYRVITFQGCFHGRTLAAIAAAKTPKMVGGFGPMTDGFDQVPWGDLEAVRAAITPETAAIHIEPVQGEGGIRAASPAYMQGLRQLCDQHGLLLFLDEIQCGMGRTGKLFAHEWSGIRPDVMCIAKALGNGFPVAACVATASAARGMTPGTHGSTYGNNPLALAVVDKVLDLFSAPGFIDDIARKGEYLAAGLNKLLAKYPKVFAEKRGMGLMQGLKCVVPEDKVLQACRARKLLIMPAGDNVVRLVPPLIVTNAQIDDALAIMSAAAQEVEASL
ncbi:MAG: aspartate aminotransferase family protein [Alphaproteobacteria bacterium]|nr:aspartate aminotransferase family protein [Alphaproteobacteria bacterium]